MFANYFKIALRNLKANKFYSILNISGLAVGLATGIMLLLWVQNELSYDTFHKAHKHIYRFSTHFKSGGENQVWQGVPGPLAVYAKSVPDVQSFVRTISEFDQVLSDKDKKKIFDGNLVAFVDSGFFSMFSFQLKQGNITTLLPNDHS